MTTTQSKAPTTTTSGRAPNERVADSIDSAKAKIIDVVEEKGSALADGANKLVGDATDKVRYLRESEPKKLGTDLLALVKRHPIMSLAIGTGVGLLISRRRRR